MDSVSVKKNVIELEERLKITFPKPYFDFLCDIKAGEIFEVEGSGIGLFSYSDLEERNETYEVDDWTRWRHGLFRKHKYAQRLFNIRKRLRRIRLIADE